MTDESIVNIEWLRTKVREKRGFLLAEFGGKIPTDRVRNLVLADVGDHTIDVAELLLYVIGHLDNVEGRKRVSGRRLTDVAHDEEGGRIDMRFEQMTLPLAEGVVSAKMRHGLAAVVEARRDLAVLNAAKARARDAGVDPARTRICDVLTAEEIAEIREQIA